MKISNLSLVAAIAVGCISYANAADSLVEAFTNGKLTGTLKAAYINQEDERRGGGYGDSDNRAIAAFGLELGYVTDPLYRFRLGLTVQGNTTPFENDRKTKIYNNKEWWATGFVLSEAYLGYAIGKTDIKFGRQYVTTPIVAGNPTRAFKEAFEGLTIVNKDIPDTTLTGGWYYKFQGRSSVVATDHRIGRAPYFKDRVILPGTGPVAHEFDNIFNVVVQNQSIENVKLTAAYARVTGIDMRSPQGAKLNKQGNANLYFAEASYTLPLSNFKLVFDVNYKGSRTTGNLDDLNYEGDMLGFRAGFKDLYGFSGSYAFTSVSDDDALIFGVGNGPISYTMLPIRGPYVFTGYAGMDVHRFILDYDFGTIGVKGLKTSLQYVKGKQDAPSVNAGPTARGTHMDVDGWAAIVSYDVAQVKGLRLSATYVSLDRDNYNVAGNVTKTDNDELWLQASYKFDLLK